MKAGRAWLHPKEIPQSWEYQEADPYVEWAVHHAALSGVAAMGDILVSDAGGVRINPGFSFGRRHPDRGRLRQRRERAKSGGEIGRPRTLPAWYTCRRCGVLFKPRQATRKFCSTDCVGPAGNAAPPDAELVRRCGEMYAKGDPLDAIAKTLGVSKATVKRWRKMAGMAPRPAGGRPKAVTP